MSKKSLSSVDLALLQMDTPDNLMVITGMMVMEAPIKAQSLKEIIEQRLLRYDRFRQRVVRPMTPFSRPYWEDDPQFDIDRHLILIDRALPEDKSILEHLVSQLMSLPLDPYRPLWQLFLVEKYGNGSVLICRFHHCIADGIALVGVVLSMTDRDNDPVDSPIDAVPSTHSTGNGRMITEVTRAGVSILADPDRTMNFIRQSVTAAASITRFITRQSDPETILRGGLGGQKRAVWEGPLPLDQIKRIGRVFGGTVNDVLIAMLAGAMRKYMLHHKERVYGKQLHSFVPVNLRSNKSKELLGNQFGFVFLTFPVGTSDPLKRLQLVHKSMNDLKSSNEAVATFGLLHLLGYAPGLQEIALSIIDSKGSAITTNVPGPREQLYLAGAPMKTLMAWVPKSGHVGLGMSILSYNGGVWLGIASDEKTVPDPEMILTYFCEEFDAFIKLVEKSPETSGSMIVPMIRKLDESIETLVEMKNDFDNKSDGSDTQNMNYCKGITISGNRCKNKVLPGDDYCYIHNGEVDKKTEASSRFKS